MVIGQMISVLSMEVFVYQEDDFTVYYNNFLRIQSSNTLSFSYSGGFEPALSILELFISWVWPYKTPYLYKAIHYILIVSLLL